MRKMMKKIVATILVATICATLTTVDTAERRGMMSGNDTTTADTNLGVYRLAKHRTFGINEEYGLSYTEGLFGLEVTVDTKDIKVKYYNHMDDMVAPLKLVEYDTNKLIKNLGTLKYDEVVTIDIGSITDGKYAITITVKGKDIDGAYFVKRSDGVNTFIASNPAKWDEVTKNLDPNDYLDASCITYPTSGMYGRVNQRKDWERIADSLIYKDGLSKEWIAHIFARYIINEYAYDEYLYSKQTTCSDMYGSYTDPSIYMLNTKSGVCWDFVNVYAIMCRHMGIPCTSVDDSVMNHTISLVYINDEWWPVDITKMVKHETKVAHPAKKDWRERKHKWTWGYSISVPKDKGRTIDDQIWKGSNALLK